MYYNYESPMIHAMLLIAELPKTTRVYHQLSEFFQLYHHTRRYTLCIDMYVYKAIAYTSLYSQDTYQPTQCVHTLILDM